MGQIVDTSVIVGLERRGLAPMDVANVGAAGEATALAAITASELLMGAHRADTKERRARRESFVETVLDSFPVLPFDLRIARTHSWVWAELAEKGRMIGDRDLLIAATALAHGYAVLTENAAEFGRVPGLDVRPPVWPQQ